MVGVAHGPVAAGAELLLLPVELLVAPVQQVDLGVVEGRVVLLVALPVDVAQEAREVRPALPGELAVEDDDVAPAGLRLDARRVGERVEQELLDHLLAVEVERAPDVARLVLVRVAAVHDLEVAHELREAAAHQPRERLRADGLEVLVLALGERQHAGLAEVAREVGVGGAAVDGRLDVRVRLRLGEGAREGRGRRDLGLGLAAHVLEAGALARALDQDGRELDGRLGPLELAHGLAVLGEAELGRRAAGVGRAEEAGAHLGGARRAALLGAGGLEGERAPEAGPGGARQLARGLGRRRDLHGPLLVDEVAGDEAAEPVGQLREVALEAVDVDELVEAVVGALVAGGEAAEERGLLALRRGAHGRLHRAAARLEREPPRGDAEGLGELEAVVAQLLLGAAAVAAVLAVGVELLQRQAGLRHPGEARLEIEERDI